MLGIQKTPATRLGPPSVPLSRHHLTSPLHPSTHQRIRLRSLATPVSSTSYAQLLEWLGEQGVDARQNVDLTVPPTAAGGPALIAVRPFAKGEIALSIPEPLWITKDTAAQHFTPPLVDDLEAWVAVALFLIDQKARPDSPWRLYLDSLPHQLSTPVAWTDAELEQLQGTQLLSTVQGYQTFFQQRFEQLQASLFSQQPDVFPSTTFTWDAFLWAACTVRARTHAPLEGDEVALVPVADCIQHASRGSENASWVVKPAGLFGRGRTLAVEVEKAFTDGNRPLTMRFDPGRTEGQILVDYGIIDVALSGGSFALTITLPEDDRFFDDKIDVLEQEGLQASNEFVVRAGDGLPPNLLGTLRLVNLQGPDAFLLESIFRAEAWAHMEQPVSEENEQAVCQSIVDGCRAVLASYPTTVEEDVAALKTAAPGSRLAAAVAVRLGEKEALESVLKLFETRLEGLEGLEYYAERRLKRLGLLDKEGKPTDWDSFFEDGIA